jgi:hypothetical protein
MRFATFFNAVTSGIHDFGCRCGFPGGFIEICLLTIDESELRVRINEASLTSKMKRHDTTPSKPGTRRKKKPIMSTPM